MSIPTPSPNQVCGTATAVTGSYSPSLNRIRVEFAMSSRDSLNLLRTSAPVVWLVLKTCAQFRDALIVPDVRPCPKMDAGLTSRFSGIHLQLAQRKGTVSRPMLSGIDTV